MFKTNNTMKLAIITFFANLYFYNQIGTLYQQSRGLSLFEVSSITSIIIFTVFIGEVPAGVVADRIGRKWSIVIAMAMQALGEWMYLFAKNYYEFVIIAIFAGLGFAFLSGANEALIYDTLSENDKEKKMKKAMGLIGSSYQLAFFIAPLAGGILVTQLTLPEYKKVIFLTAISASFAFLLSFTLKEPDVKYQHAQDGPYTILKSGFFEIRNSPLLKKILLISTFTATFSGLLVSLYQPYFVASDVPIFWIGASLALGGLFAALTQAYAYKLEEAFGKKMALVVLSMFPGLMFILLAVVKIPLVLVPIFVLTYGFSETRNPLLSSYTNVLIGSKNRATVLSLINMVNSLYIAIVVLIVGLIANYSLPIAFLLVGIIIIFATIILRVDKLPAEIQKSNTGIK